MSTRANLTIVTKQGKFKMQSNSSAYPSHMMEAIIKFATSTASNNAIFDKEAGIDEKVLGFYPEPESWDLATFIEACGLTFGSVGNPSYFYEIDFVNRHVKVWGRTSRWINAPVDWKEKGWAGVYEGKNGKIGYMDCNIRGKMIYHKTLKELVKEVNNNEPVLNEGVITFAENIG